MVDNLVDQAISAYLATISGLNVVAGMVDNYPNLAAPYCAVYSVVQKADGKNPVYTLLTTVEYVSVSGDDTVATVQATMSAIDALLGAPARLTGELGCVWQAIDKTQQDVGDRRKNVRELQVFAQVTLT